MQSLKGGFATLRPLLALDTLQVATQIRRSAALRCRAVPVQLYPSNTGAGSSITRAGEALRAQPLKFNAAGFRIALLT